VYLVPKAIPLWAFHQVLADRGLIDRVRAIIAALPEPTRTHLTIRIEYKDPILRANPSLDSLGVQLGLSAADIDDIFREAGKLN
jgi:hypothetical protein